LTLPLPPRSTLFPYTTLFRSSGHVLSDDEALLAFVTLVARHLDGGSIALPLSATAHAERLAEEHGVGILRTKMSNAALMEAASRDRKSTRLNSSHVKISYAVF